MLCGETTYTLEEIEQELRGCGLEKGSLEFQKALHRYCPCEGMTTFDGKTLFMENPSYNWDGLEKGQQTGQLSFNFDVR